MNKAIEVANLSYGINNIEILHQCNLTVNKGEIMAIMGPNGCGKTTLINCILGFNTVGNDKIFICNEDLSKMKRSQIAKRISYVQQSNQNESGLHVYDYLSLGRIAHKNFGENINQKDDNIIKSVAEEIGITAFLYRPMMNLSGGEKQLAMIAKALVQETDIIVMDEPASALDFANQAKLLNQIKKVNKLGKTIIFSTHNPNHVLALNAKTCIMQAGKIEMIGGIQECISSGLFNEIYGDCIKVISDGKNVTCSFELTSV